MKEKRLFPSILLLIFFSFSALAQELSINILSFTDATKADAARVVSALELLQEVVNSPDFHQQIIGMKYKLNKKTYRGFSQTRQPASRVLESIFRAEEFFADGSTGVIDLNMDMYYEKCTPLKCVVGYTTRKDPYFHMNRYLHKNYSPAKVAGNIFHEWLHKIGHGHTYFNNSARPHSVPYKLGYIVAKMAAKIAAEGDPLREHMWQEDFLEMLQQNCDH